MCGLAGMAGNGIIDADVKLFADLLYVTALRGEDATGLYTVNHKTGDGRLAKESTSADYFLWNSKQKNNILAVKPSSVYIGHCRAATRGALNKDNAHPFDVGSLVGAHNGTLTDSKYLVKDKTDSEMMFADMAKSGIKDVLEGLDGSSAFAVSVWDKDKKRLILARNDERPLWIAIDKQHDVMFWSSEQAFLEMIASRKNRKFEIRWLRAGSIYEFDIDNIKKDHLTPYDVTEIKLKPATSWIYSYDTSYGGSNHDYGSFPDQRSSKREKTTDTLEFTSSDGVLTTRGSGAITRGEKWECDVCGEGYRGPGACSKTFQEDECKAYLCKTCAPWVKSIHPRTRELSIKQNVS